MDADFPIMLREEHYQTIVNQCTFFSRCPPLFLNIPTLSFPLLYKKRVLKSMEYMFQRHYIALLDLLNGFFPQALCHPGDKPSILRLQKAHHMQSLLWKFELISPSRSAKILNIEHFECIMEGFFVTFSGIFEIRLPFCTYRKSFRHWVSGKNFNS